MKIINRKIELTRENNFIFRLYILGVRICKKFINIQKICKCKYDKKPTSDGRKSVLIVKTDSIGDYILMRNFWKIVKESEKYKDAKITLILSSAMRGVAEALDKDTVEKIFYVPHPFWLKSDCRKLKILKKLFAQGLDTHFDTVMFPNVHVWNFLVFNNMLCQTIDADEYIGQIGDLDWTSIPIMAKLANLTHVVPNYTARSTFEFDNNVDFFTRATDEKISLKMHEIKRKKNTVKDTIVISPCAQDGYRMWHINNFVHILNWLIKNGKNVVLVGGKNDAKYLNKLNNKVNSKCTVMAGMPWNNLIDTINNAELFIGMDSGNLHLAISLQTPAVAISSGMSYTRFMAYPKSDKYKIVFAPNTLDELTKYVSKPRNKTTFCPFIGSINSVSVSQVIDAANKLLQKRKK